MPTAPCLNAKVEAVEVRVELLGIDWDLDHGWNGLSRERELGPLDEMCLSLPPHYLLH